MRAGEPLSVTLQTPDPDASLAERAYDELGRMILTRTLPGGSSVVEGRLAQQLDISRTPMREAILRLAAEGLLVKQGSRSYVVRQVQPVEFFQALKIRELLEAEAIELAIGRVPKSTLDGLREGITRLGSLGVQDTAHWEMDDRLHLLFPEVLGNGVLVRMIRSLRVTTRLFELTSPAGRVAADAAEHLDILKAFESGDARRARAAMVTHLRNVAAEILDVVSGRDGASHRRRSRG
ncbi:GntR family transcriptional regulator [Lichenihabitans sp. PAMC28606]|uniref:GntR family transcriptional regulator n=1 Tax=Lichenihabitans sp. PAMC28606 TaxID=2880932 RepID=UPI001D0B1523|nr:GntR family transcriptional regulator [Lichenihabitans sp. PAMC28606]UDL93662.1 GntR family transcriptional regulator [Lichenihabitans sp. PAMC28606]